MPVTFRAGNRDIGAWMWPPELDGSSRERQPRPPLEALTAYGKQPFYYCTLAIGGQEIEDTGYSTQDWDDAKFALRAMANQPLVELQAARAILLSISWELQLEALAKKGHRAQTKGESNGKP